MKRKILTFFVSILMLGALNAQVIFDPAEADTSMLSDGMTLVNVDGTDYVQVVLNGWNNFIDVDSIVMDEGRTHFTCMAKFSGGVSEYTTDQVKTFLKLVSPSGVELAAGTSASSEEFTEYQVSLNVVDTVWRIQIAGQQTVSWGAVTGDTMWIGKIEAITVIPPDPTVIWDPARVSPLDLPEGWSIVDIEGTKYARIVLDAWNTYTNIEQYELADTVTHFQCMAKYAVGTSGYTVDQINTFLKLSNPSWSELGAAGAPSSAEFTEYTVPFANLGTCGVLQVAGQETTGWSAVSGDTLYLGKIKAIKIIPPPMPYKGNAAIIPGTVYAEKYDEGGQDVAYYDNDDTIQYGGVFRPDEGVDIQASGEEVGGYNIGWTGAGEWVNYTIKVVSSGMYKIQVVAANGNASNTGKFTLEFGEEAVTDTFYNPPSGGWQVYDTLEQTIELPKGTHTMTLREHTGWINFNKAIFTRAPGGSQAIPGMVFADIYNEGGNGVGYYEADDENSNANATWRVEESVEFEPSALGGFNVGWTNADEWLKYDVMIEEDGMYEVEVSVASGGDGGSFVVDFESGVSADTFTYAGTGGWQNWITLKDTVELTAGEDVMTVTFATGGVNYQKTEFTLLGANAKLDSIHVDGAPLAGFFPSTLSYRIPVMGGAEAPEIMAYADDPDATVDVMDPETLPGTAKIMVTSADESVTRTYEVLLDTASTDTRLKAINRADTLFIQPEAGVFSYDFELPAGTKSVPTITAVPNDANAMVEITKASELPGTTEIVVTAEDTASKATYMVNFTLAVSVDELRSVTHQKLDLYPNPVSTVLHLNSTTIQTAEIYNVVGERVLNIRLDNENSIDVSTLRTGVYFIKVRDIEGNILVGKFNKR